MLCAGRAWLAARLLQQVSTRAGWYTSLPEMQASAFASWQGTAARVQCCNRKAHGQDSHLLNGLCLCKAAAMACRQRVLLYMVTHTLKLDVPNAGTTLGRGRCCRASCQCPRTSPEWVCASMVAAAAPWMAARLRWIHIMPCAPRLSKCSCIALQWSPLQHGTFTHVALLIFHAISAVHPHGLAAQNPVSLLHCRYCATLTLST